MAIAYIESYRKSFFFENIKITFFSAFNDFDQVKFGKVLITKILALFVSLLICV